MTASSTRRAFLLGTTAAVAGCAGRAVPPQAPRGPSAGAPSFDTDAPRLAAKWRAAVDGLHRNVVPLDRYPRGPVLIEGEGYPGIWLECGPLESLVFQPFAPAVARASHGIFFALQREDGYLPCYVWDRKHRNKVGAGQIQMVVPIAATALEVFEADPDERFLAAAYSACARWDDWLVAHRNTRGTGLCEAFCGYDTGHDNSPRFEGHPWECPGGDARNLPRATGKPHPLPSHPLPFLAPDLSASVYGGRLALAAMARHFGKRDEEARWREKADAVRAALLRRCLDPEDVCFYDVDAQDRFVRIKHDAITRVCGEHVPDRALFEQVYARHLRNPKEFWAPYPFPSVALDDPAFVRTLPLNSWGGATQALTALRAPRWMEFYGKHADLAHVMRRWLEALCAAPEFMQQMSPFTGEMSTSRQYSPAMLVLLDFVARLHGVRRDGATLVWACHLPEGATRATYELPAARARLTQGRAGATLEVGGRRLLDVVGPARVVTDLDGRPRAVVGTSPAAATVTVTAPGAGPRTLTVAPDQVVPLP